MKDEEIKKIIQRDYNEFLNQQFPEDIPSWIIDMLPAAIMSLPQLAVPYQGERIKAILGKKSTELTIFDIGLVINILTAVSPKCFGIDIILFLDRKKVMEYISLRWNQLTSAQQKRLDVKAASLQDAKGKNGLQKV
jgi:hypothetical protein